MGRLLTIGIALVAAVGGLIYGIDSGIIGTTLGQAAFQTYMYGPSGANTALEGAIVSSYNAGQAVGGFLAGFLADLLSRRYSILLGAFVAAFGAALQAAAVDVSMMIVGRAVAGIACGLLLSVVPVYIAEIAPPKSRGFIVGLQGMAIASGFAVANWIGYGSSYAVGNATWQIPLAMQIPAAVVLFAGMWFVPFSPRWLIQKDRIEEARQVLAKLHADESASFVDQELIQIRSQMQLERAQTSTLNLAQSLGQLFSPRFLRRTATASFILTMTQLSGSSVIQNFQSSFYATAGFEGQQALLISGAYGMMGVVGQLGYLFVVADRWPRRTTMWSGSFVLSAMIAVCMALSAVYGSGDNAAGARGAIAFIFLYSVAYALFFNGLAWVIASELFPFFLRSRGVAVAVFIKAVVAIVLSQITPLALAAVSWRYYALFIASNAAAGVLYFFFLPETSGQSLEEIAELFGDTLAAGRIGEIDVDAKTADLEAVDHVDEPERRV